MKIIATDNYNRETVSDELVCENVSEFWGKVIVKYLNYSQLRERYFILVSNDHKLYKFEP